MSSYTNTPAAQYQLQQANQAQNNSAAASGGLLSGSNERALGTIDQGIVSQGANTAYNEYLQGNQQGFGQLESALGNMFRPSASALTATGQDVSATNVQNQATAALTAQQAQAGQAKGSGLGSMFSGLSSLATILISKSARRDERSIADAARVRAPVVFNYCRRAAAVGHDGKDVSGRAAMADVAHGAGPYSGPHERQPANSLLQIYAVKQIRQPG